MRIRPILFPGCLQGRRRDRAQGRDGRDVRRRRPAGAGGAVLDVVRWSARWMSESADADAVIAAASDALAEAVEAAAC